MSARAVTPRRTRAVIAASVCVTVALTVAGMWQRALAGPLWPAMLTDWSLGAALLALSSVGVGAVVASRLPRNIVAWLFLLMGVVSSVVFASRWTASVALQSGGELAAALWSVWVLAWLIPINMTILSLLLLGFPFGAMPGRRWRLTASVIVVIGIATSVTTALAPYVPDQTPFPTMRNPTAVVDRATGGLLVGIMSELLLLGFVVSTVTLVVRLRRARGAERQQLKWFCFAAIVTVTTYIWGFWVTPVFVIATLIGFPAVPIAAGVAVLRYRLYDIDRVINRTVVYGMVTGILAVAYLVGVTALRTLTEPFAGDTALAVAASTLAVAALFQPVRTSIQRAVDRRFNRARYDAAATVASLRVRLRDEVDLDALKADLVDVVCATMQPATTTLWLRETKR